MVGPCCGAALIGAATPLYPRVMEISELAKNLVVLGCPSERSAEMAAQLDKRARQLAE